MRHADLSEALDEEGDDEVTESTATTAAGKEDHQSTANAAAPAGITEESLTPAFSSTTGSGSGIGSGHSPP